MDGLSLELSVKSCMIFIVWLHGMCRQSCICISALKFAHIGRMAWGWTLLPPGTTLLVRRLR